MTKQELVKLLYDNFYVDNAFGGIIDLTGLDFTEYDCEVQISNMKVSRSLVQDSQQVGEDLFQYNQNVQGDLFQDKQKVGGDIWQKNQDAKGDVVQNVPQAQEIIEQLETVIKKLKQNS